MSRRTTPRTVEPALPRRLSWSLGSGTILQGLNSAVIAIALVPIAAEFGQSDSIPWLVSGLYIAAAVGSPTAGRLSDLFGPRRIYLAGLVIALVASVAGPFMPTAEALVADRILLGLGTSAQFPAAMAIIRRQATHTGSSPRKAIGTIALCGQTSAAIAPTIGGLVVVTTGWEGVFWINVPVVLASFLLVLFLIPADDARPATMHRSAIARFAATMREIDPLGIVLFIATLSAAMVGILSLNNDPLWIVLFAAVPLAALFALRELKSRKPFIDVRLLVRNRDLMATCGRAVITFVSFYSIFYGLPQWLETTAGFDAGLAGLLMLPIFGIGILSTVIAGMLGKRVPPRVLLLIGSLAVIAAGSVVVLVFHQFTPIWAIALVSVLFGVPNGFNNLGNQFLLHESSTSGTAGTASGIYRTSQYLGAIASSLIVAHVLDVTEVDGGIDEFGILILGCGVLMLITSGAWRVLRR
jgi:MFS family permease